MTSASARDSTESRAVRQIGSTFNISLKSHFIATVRFNLTPPRALG